MVCLSILKFFFLIVINNLVNGKEVCYSTNFQPTPDNIGVFPENHDVELVGHRINNWKRGDKHNVEEYSNLFDGDIMLTEEQLHASTLPAGKIWDRAEMPFHITSEYFSERQIAYIRSTMDIITNHTGVKFRRYCYTKDRNYAVFQSEKTGCWSYVGMLGKGQVINLQIPNCLYRGTMIHIILHALGFYHQHNSPVRDNWLSVKWENIVSTKKNYYKTVDTNASKDSDVLYDYDSIMHGGPYLHSFNEKPTLETHIPHTKIGQREAFSLRDVEKVRRVYEEEVKKWIPIERLPDMLNQTTQPVVATESTTVSDDSSAEDTSEVTSTDDIVSTAPSESTFESIPTAEVISTTEGSSDETTTQDSEMTDFSTSEEPLTTEDYDTDSWTTEESPESDDTSTIPDNNTNEPGSTSDDDGDEDEETTDTHEPETTPDDYEEETTPDDYEPETTEDGYITETTKGGYIPKTTEGEYTPETTTDSENKLTTESPNMHSNSSTTAIDKRILNVFCLMWPYTINETCRT